MHCTDFSFLILGPVKRLKELYVHHPGVIIPSSTVRRNKRLNFCIGHEDENNKGTGNIVKENILSTETNGTFQKL